ncbi:hypothetical protein BYT27DRAFT_7094201 [Phlegmacium glaucopus]|nr:hypothetical protein BYT27DRAFT_7094201 [Phlegmacium glaucopus]
MANRTSVTGETLQRRIFIGPMPERVIAQTEATQHKRSQLTIGSVFSLTQQPSDNIHNTDKIEEVSRLLKEQAFHFFLHEGGKPEDWDEEQEQHLTDELVQRWKSSEWGQLWTRRHHRKKESQSIGGHQWFGTSFEVGTLMGVNVLQGKEHIVNLSAPCIPARAEIDESSNNPLEANKSRFHVVSTGASSTSQVGGDALKSIPSVEMTPTTSRTALLPPHRSDVMLPANESLSPSNNRQVASDTNISRASAISDNEPLSNTKGKAKAVRYSEHPDPGFSSPNPVPHEEVLARTKSTTDVNTSLAASLAPQGPISSDVRWGDVILRDRMLVSVNYSKLEGLIHFDDSIHRTTRNLQFEDWGEFLVAWRKDSLEIYRDHRTPGKEWAIGRKYLAYVIPLKSSKTKVSLYSFVDLTFCITCTPTTTRLNEGNTLWSFIRNKEGTNIFIFKPKSRSRAYDWIWQLWRHMGGRMPRTVDIHNPGLSTKVTIDIPEDADTEGGGLYSLFKRENVIKLCVESLRSVPDWKFLMEKEINGGKSLQLAWRVDANLDWVWLETDVFGEPRDWAVLCGLAFKQALRQPVLEIRMAQHAPTYIHLKNGRRFEEPPAIEGYLDRIRPHSQAKQPLYLTTHDGNLFILSTHAAFPPMPPGLTPLTSQSLDPQGLRHAEIRRGINQIMTATGMCDLRTILAVRRALQAVPTHTHDQKEATTDDTSWFGIWENSELRTADDEEDEGGDSGLHKSADRTRLRMRRSFELLLNTGHVVRFEAHSSQVAIEWIERLRALIFYWKSRHRMDAKQEIELAQARRPRLTPQTRLCRDDEHPPEAPQDLSAPYAAMDNLYNWCVLEGCKPIVKAGKIYVKEGLRKQYKYVILFEVCLVAGHLVRFRIDAHSALYTSIRKKISLLDAYVISGYFAALTLPKGQYMPNAEPCPRRYYDGLETDDREEDMLFMICYRPYPHMMNADQDPTVTPVNLKSIPSLSAKRKMLVFKARSNLERDAWCWALNAEIEKMVRVQKVREDKMRESGNLMKLG